VLFLASVGLSCEEEERVPSSEFCEPDTLKERPLECCHICPPSAALGEDGCELTAAPSEWPGRSVTWEAWRQMCDSANVSAGRCDNGLSFVNWNSLGNGETRYFDASGAFVALEGFTDFEGGMCQTTWYWPTAVECGGLVAEMGCRAMMSE
jgi:hypothetical protein